MGFTIPAPCFAAEHPVPSILRLKILRFYPLPWLVGVSAACPSPQCLEDRMVYLSKGTFTADVPVIVGPPPNQGVELHDQVTGFGLFIV